MQLMYMALVFHVASCLDLKDPEWISFKAKYNKTYSGPEEEASRLVIFKTNLRRVAEHNAIGSSFRLAVNHLADLSPTEYLALLTPAGPPVSPDASLAGHVRPVLGPVRGGGDYKDWREDGAVAKVKLMGQSCGGASWAFAAVAAMESAWQIAGYQLVTLSEQQLIDCTKDYGNAGCEGGLARQAFNYLMDSDGLCTDNVYPYRDGTDFICRRVPSTATLSNWIQTTRGNEAELEYVVSNIGPVAARVDASHTSFQMYSNGVYDQRSCSTSQLNLAVAVVGYGIETVNGQGVPYWLVKNAWGPGWGDGGYIKMRKDAQNMCGIATDATYPVV